MTYMKETLYEKLEKIKENNHYGFHMPGHKRQETESIFAEVMKMDITEIDGFDNLHHAEGILREEQNFAAKLYGALKSFFLVNGSTAGVLAAICASTKDGDRIIFSRNAHKSAYHALYLKGLFPRYVYPQEVRELKFIQGKIAPEEVRSQMKKSGATVVFITSPTYEGVVSDISAIAEIVHERNGILIVDEAHGAHLGFHPYFPQSAVKQGADIVVQSLHKTLPSLTQTGILHVCSSRVCVSEIERWLGIFQTSSPSYVLMSSMSRCMHLLKDNAKEYFSNYETMLCDFYRNMENLQNLKVVDPVTAKTVFEAQTDPSKIVICAENLEDFKGQAFGGKQLADCLLESYGLQMEMISEKYVLAMTSIYDTKIGFNRLKSALLDLDGKVHKKDVQAYDTVEDGQWCGKEAAVMTIKQAIDGEKEPRRFLECVGEVSAEFVYLYPPGSPILVPGECITDEICTKIQQYKEKGLNVQGPSDYTLRQVMTVKTGNNIQ